jgi:hypothetical protein
VNPRDPSRGRRGSEPSEHDLREILEEAERRKDLELHRKSRILSLFVGIPTIAFIVWGASVYVENQSIKPPVVSRPLVPVKVDDSRDITELDNFRPKAMRAGSSTPPAQILQEGGKLVDEEDIRFVMQLMNFSQVPAPKEKKER